MTMDQAGFILWFTPFWFIKAFGYLTVLSLTAGCSSLLMSATVMTSLNTACHCYWGCIARVDRSWSCALLMVVGVACKIDID